MSRKSDEKTTLQVSKKVAGIVKKEAADARIPMYEWVNRAVVFFRDHGEVRIEVSKRTAE